MSTMVRNVIAGLAALVGSVTTAFDSPLTIDDLKGTWTLVEIRSRPVPRAPVNALPVSRSRIGRSKDSTAATAFKAAWTSRAALSRRDAAAPMAQ